MQAKIAVIGSGMAGLTAAYLCRRGGHAVTVFEAAPARGMDQRATVVEDAKGRGVVDVPLRVMSRGGWQSVLALCQAVAVDTFAVDTPVSLSWLDRKTWFRTATLKFGAYSLPMLGALRYVRRESLVIGKDLWRFERDFQRFTAQDATSTEETVEEFFTRRGYEPVFWRGFILPLLSTVATCRGEHLLRYPAKDLLAVVHGIIFGVGRLRRITGGTRALVDRLVENLRLISAAPVTTLTATAEGVTVRNARGDGGVFDYAVIATQANELGFLGDAFAAERAMLGRVVFDDGELVVHSDQRVMPKCRSDWTALNYLMDRQFATSMFSVWVNAVEPSLVKAPPVFQTWNPVFDLDPAQVRQRFPMQRAVATPQSRRDLAALGAMQDEPGRRVFFCGSWAAPGVPLLESAVRSAIALAHRLQVPVQWDPCASTAS